MRKVKKNKVKVIKSNILDRVNQEVKSFIDIDILKSHLDDVDDIISNGSIKYMGLV